jgi:phosphotransferase system enzyme I (PtsP)
MRAAVQSGLTAESAVEQVQTENRMRLQGVKDPYLRERMHDLDDLSNRLLRHLAGEAGAMAAELPLEAVLFARALGPAELLEYDRARLKGLVVAEASATSHVAIIARALNIPLVAGPPELVDLVEAGDDVIVDGDAGDVLVRQTLEITQSYREKAVVQSQQAAAFAAESELATVTRDGVAIDIFMNAGIPLDMDNLERTGAAGVGLFRTELQFLIGAQLPRAAAQERFYGQILELAGGRPVVFRTADLGGDKAAAYMKRRDEPNPAMGWRGMRMAVDRPGLFRPQIRALLAAAAAAGRDLHILFPMITVIDEIDFARELLDREMDLRRRRGRPMPRAINFGAMIETPAAAWRAASIAERVDFLSIGGNDLAQFYFAADREAELTQRRFDPIDHGFLSFIGHIANAAKSAGRPLTYCGEQAADPLMAAALLAVGVRRFSVSASAIGAFRRLVRSVRTDELAGIVAARADRPQGRLRRDLEFALRQAGADLP